MAENFSDKPKFFSFWGDKRTAKEKKQARLIILLLLGFSFLSIGLAVTYREIPLLLRRLTEPTTVVSRGLLPTPTATPTPKLEKERKAVEEIIAPLRGTYEIYFQDLTGGDSFAINSQIQSTAASLIKLPVLLSLYREADAGRINLDTVYQLQAADKRAGAGSLQGKPTGYEITYRKMAELMGQQSDNTAFNIVANKVLGGAKVQETADKLGMKQTSFDKNLTSAADIGLFFRKLYLEKVVSEKSREEILGFLTNTIWEGRIPVGIPKGIRIAHKIGSETGVFSDAGIIYAKKPFILVIMTENANEIEANKALPEIAKKVYEMWEQ